MPAVDHTNAFLIHATGGGFRRLQSAGKCAGQADVNELVMVRKADLELTPKIACGCSCDFTEAWFHERPAGDTAVGDAGAVLGLLRAILSAMVWDAVLSETAFNAGLRPAG